MSNGSGVMMRKSGLRFVLILGLSGLALPALLSPLGATVANQGTMQSIPFPGISGLPDLFIPLMYQTHTIAPGETITSIAKDYGRSLDTLLSFNKISAPRRIKPNQSIKIPSMDGLLVTLDAPRTAWEICDKYHVELIKLLLANYKDDVNTVFTGDIFLPEVKMDSLELKKILGEYFLWPTSGGRISSFFGHRRDPFTGASSSHTGLDIANYWGAPVYAASEGRVLSASYDDVLGYHIRIDQGQGFTVVYGHLSSMLIKPGQKIKRGQLIGRVGSTGYSTGPHLHFGVYRWGRLQNPLNYFG